MIFVLSAPDLSTFCPDEEITTFCPDKSESDDDLLRSIESQTSSSVVSTSDSSSSEAHHHHRHHHHHHHSSGGPNNGHWRGFFRLLKKGSSAMPFNTFTPLKGVPKLTRRKSKRIRDNMVPVIPALDTDDLFYFKPSWRNFSLQDIQTATNCYSRGPEISKEPLLHFQSIKTCLCNDVTWKL